MPSRLSGLLLLFVAAAPGRAQVLPDALGPLRPTGPVETYDPETLWERINGEAELLRQFGLVSAAFRYYQVPDEPEREVEVAVYTAADALNGFGLFAANKPWGGEALELGSAAASDGYQLVLWHGRYCLRLYGYGSGAQRGADLRAAATLLAEQLGPPPPPPAVLRHLESLGLRDLRLEPRHVFGRETLPPGLVGSPGDGVEAFLAVGRPSGTTVLEAEAVRLPDGRRKTRGDVQLLTGTDPALGPLILAARGDRLAGVRGAGGREHHLELLGRMLDDP